MGNKHPNQSNQINIKYLQVKVEDLPKTKESRVEMLYTTTYGVWDFPTEADDIVKMEGVYSGSSIHEAGKNDKVL